jgi:hypothetical protein
MNKYSLKLAAGMILVASLSQFIPHPPNFSPMAAIAMFGGAKLGDKRLAFFVTLASLLVCDLIQGLHQLIPFVYGSYAINICLGIALRGTAGPGRVASASIVGSILFFAITNFGVWALLGTFPLSLVGLLACYAAALPYFQNTLLSGLFYSIFLFGGAAWAEHRNSKLNEYARAKAAR